MGIYLLEPAFKDYIWGGTRLRDEYGKDCSYDKVAESWELSCHKDGPSVISGSGMTLQELIDKEGRQILGTNCERFENFPILIKLIDAKDNLSVQVHPDNDYAMRVEGEYGKTEMWYVVDCDEGAELLYGFKHEISKEEFAQRIADNTLLEVTNNVPVHKGDVFFIKSGTLHAIGKGILIAEIQQNSNTTYRIYDYGRVGKDGKPRELHVEKAKDVTKLAPAETYPDTPVVQENGASIKLLSKCEYFTTYKVDIEEKAEFDADDSSFVSLLILEGSPVVTDGNSDPVSAKKGDSLFISAGTGRFTVEGSCSLILTKIDD
ncbi:mannose-6-phosphate isomerase, class I [Ruminococcus albus]|uniref:mannose-6-phosphate isomerase n=1 Tax=Ruminococcus albus (strain ATCC 27210 / DSM 20455 / JCM 14654 / NCDO 2250 / 7) TaxID=697329 RepID=E6UII6_RUMA7|nr:mannose-6-phosphate isomerase, class I [Ruminococcus albus]ADU23331.1 mannose-6-phosphate isomerase, class I [Ruminococcus albus 7 = DSM 20455]